MSTKLKFFVLIIAFSQQCCESKSQLPIETPAPTPVVDTLIYPGATQTTAYWPKLAGKKLGLIVNQTTMIGETHLVDSLLSAGMDIQVIFAPEHGFRGGADAGEHVQDGVDVQTGLPIISLYGSHKAPTAEDLAGIDLLVFDIQDVGARFYTYISTLHYVMQSAAKYDIPIMVLDRPNPNGHFVDGPIMEDDYRSFVGMHPVPVVHGMTIGEYAAMINGEGWLGEDLKASLEVILCKNYSHSKFYELPVRPSPNLPNMRSIYLYPHLCFFEGTAFSVGRGTQKQFQIYGHPDFPTGNYSFTPKPMFGAKYPKLDGKACKGVDLTASDISDFQNYYELNLSYLLSAFNQYEGKESFFLKNGFFEKLAGTKTLREQIQAGWTEEQIRETWRPGLESFNKMRLQYLRYPQ